MNAGKESILMRMTKQQQFLVSQSLELLDYHYDEEERLTKEEDGGELSTRSSAHYALALLLRDGVKDRDRACGIILRVLDMQLDAPEELYHGTFRISPDSPVPAKGHMAWGIFPPGIAYSIHTTMEALFDRFACHFDHKFPSALDGKGAQAARGCFADAVAQVLPPVWKSYDPNWREFIACTFALILEHFETELPRELVILIDAAMDKAVNASIARQLSQSIPMNTNIELMHAFIAHYYGHRSGNSDWISHADKEARRLLSAYSEYDSFAEFNSTTYYGVDLTVLGMWRRYAKAGLFRSIGAKLESGLWRNIAMFYHPGLENMAGPYARSYEMDMLKHSSMGVLLYLALGDAYKHLAVVNCETSHDSIIALVGVDVPVDVLSYLSNFREDRLVRSFYRELCERDKPGMNTHLCKAEAWIGREWMIGALSGSRNTSGQLHPATIHWQTRGGERYSLRLLRRVKGGPWSAHLRGIVFDVHAGEGQLEVEVRLDTKEELEIFFEADGPGLEASTVTSKQWSLPGLLVHMRQDAPEPVCRMNGSRMEIIYLHQPQPGQPALMRFQMELALVREI